MKVKQTTPIFTPPTASDFCGSSVPEASASTVHPHQTQEAFINTRNMSSDPLWCGNELLPPTTELAPTQTTQSVLGIRLAPKSNLGESATQVRLEDYYKKTMDFLMRAFISNPEEAYGTLNQIGISLQMLGSDTVKSAGENYFRDALQTRVDSLTTKPSLTPEEKYELDVTNFALAIDSSLVSNLEEPSMVQRLKSKLQEFQASSEEVSLLGRPMQVEIDLLATLFKKFELASQ